MTFLYAALVVGFMVLMLVAAIRQKQQLTRDLEANFRTQTFGGTHGPVFGKDLVIISKRTAASDHNRIQRSLPGTRTEPVDEFWYCVGPGSEYLAIVLLYELRWKSIDIKWSARALTQERFRAALFGDRRGLRELARFERQFHPIPGQPD